MVAQNAHLVQKENQVHILEDFVLTDGFEELHRVDEPVDCRVLF